MPKTPEAEDKAKASHKPLVARRYALKLRPPAVVLEYWDGVKTRLRTVKLLELNQASDVERLTAKVLRSFPRALDSATVSRSQVKRLLEHLKAKLSQQAGDAVNDGAGGNASVTVDAERADKVESTVEEELDMEPEIDLNDPNLDLNKVSITQLKKAKAKMEEQFSKNQKLPGEMGFQYDVQVDFQFSEGVGDWDDSDADQD
mmetsp:Transcript_13586/g.26107  ORF Transcript_13586/g.26107 Transcript_13586/m.26107 type:complete len:202 (-) Transcript_13586:190-795(-)|eukprot:CAMPEP_0114253512 /NCGR_PEP_ID=MMETSP0058-20121206/16435_1 /TAXON_ID=36894 /ORGANISM="Pyramimonas parkeae, CCMP726" /LENGTH=201 /DNA_ID=CAMNT_0001367569 /DNA_START=209 /DNA_END=814 /DNA_ORIENTATION=+